MRNLVIALLIFVATSAQATTLKDFSGVFKGTRVEVVNGKVVYFFQKSTFVYRDGTLNGTAVIQSGNAYFIGYGSYNSDGSYSGTLMYQGRVAAVTTGSWFLRANTIHVSATTSYANGLVVSANAKLQMVSKRKLVAISITSDGTISLTLHRIR